ncbi:hypothetical protein Lfu02_44480 [Longispora fulva]|uniref:GmrSD restriction endonucleases C-terminal domain-containing protein n=1 Tax=Longispora fulva TaxID=619741 RepID=A0A8J7KG31_9ACTN|nr:DUF1524 domain-containing protein [Longispora fulva]MBG6136905.1 hypothetical protein [Longispora fulva]GIG60076.1 hypothetical protein Lfu02_44480 [Longispora fulva]
MPVLMRGLLAALAAATVLLSGAAPAQAGTEAMPTPPPADKVRAELETLHVEAPHPMAGYSREKFPHWARQYGKCDTREVVLARDGEGVEQDTECRAVSGTWYSEYDGRTFDSAGQIDVDHMVPLANAWRSGADTWDTPRRKEFANDLTRSQLIGVSASSNRAKGDQSPDLWRPPLRSYWCTYARAWGSVKYHYDLNVTATEKVALTEMLDTCV